MGVRIVQLDELVPRIAQVREIGRIEHDLADDHWPDPRGRVRQPRALPEGGQADG